MEADPELEISPDSQDPNLIQDDVIEDWGLILKLQGNSNGKNSSRTVVPKRGAKEFEPIANIEQSGLNRGHEYDVAQLNNSRNLMYNALEQPRGFTIKKSAVDSQTIVLRFDKGDTIPIPYIFSPRGKFLDSIGNMDKDGKTLYLTIEEALFLIERGSCILKFEGIDYPLSLEDAYSLLLIDKDYDYNTYLVYRHLKTFGYIVQRYTKITTDTEVVASNTKSTAVRSKTGIFKYFRNLFSYLINRVSVYFPYTRYSSVFKHLNGLLYPPAPTQRQSTTETRTSPRNNVTLQIAFNVWKPNTKFKKRTPPMPDFQVVINDCNTMGFPKHAELMNLLNQSDMVPISPPHTRLGIDTRKLKYGNKRIVIATIDNGIINFNQVSLTNFRPQGGEYKDMFTWRDEWLNPKKKRPAKNNNKDNDTSALKALLRRIYPV